MSSFEEWEKKFWKECCPDTTITHALRDTWDYQQSKIDLAISTLQKLRHDRFVDPCGCSACSLIEKTLKELQE